MKKMKEDGERLEREKVDKKFDPSFEPREKKERRE